MIYVNIDKLVLAVVALAGQEGGDLAELDFHGSAFCIGKGLWMTAAHVARAAIANGQTLGLAYLNIDNGGPVKSKPVSPDQIFIDDEIDVAVFRAGVTGTVLSTFITGELQLLTDLGVFGYPAAVGPSADGNEKQWEVLFRATKGHIVSRKTFSGLPSHPPVYEVNCRLPGGFSGAPALLEIPGGFAVAGVVIGEEPLMYRGVSMPVGIVMPASEIVGRTMPGMTSTVAELLKPPSPDPSLPIKTPVQDE